MSYQYRITQEALSDLEKIWLHTDENWSEQQADKYYNDLIKGIEFISTNPEIGKEIDYVKKGYRKFVIQSHLIFYQISQNMEIEIIRVLHQSMDVKGQLKK